jgi:predicted regulator of Ras-like GTPase activity (Roadblock/LC7/MglB family)
VNIIVVNSRLLCAGELGRNLLDGAYIPGDHDDVMFVSIGKEVMFTTLVRENVKFGVTLLEMRYVAEDLQRVVG